MRRLTRNAAVVATLAAGHGITTLLPTDKVAAAPFVTAAAVGEHVRLPYAEVRLAGIHLATKVQGQPTTATPYGRFLVVDLEVTALREPLLLAAPYLRDGEGRRYAADTGAQCATAVTLPTGLPRYARMCIDVPRHALDGATVVIARGAIEIDGYRRDAVAEIELSLDSTAAELLWNTAAPVTGFLSGPAPPGDWARA